MNLKRSLTVFAFSLFCYAGTAQWACYPLGSGGSSVCGWACYSGHQGQDWQYTPNNTSYGQNIYAVDAGTVVYVETGWTGCDDPFIAGGNDWNQPSNKIIIQHTNGLYTRYVHIKDVIPGIAVGSVVAHGEVIAYVGNVGPISPCNNSDPNINAHLHFEVGTGWSGNTLTGRYDPVSIFYGGYPPFCGNSTTLTNTNCTGSFFDSGGPNATYANFENYTFTIAPAGTSAITVNFYWLDLELNYDFLYVYDGPSTASPLIGTYTGSNNPGTLTSSGGAITFQFTSDVSTLGQGWSADWSCAAALPTNLAATNYPCASNAVVLSWQNTGPGWFADISTDPLFSTFYNKDISNLTTTLAPQSFCDFPACTSFLSFQPNTTYYWRIWNGSVQVNGASFTTPTCLYNSTACSGNFDDAGGPSANYGDDEDYVFTIEPLGASSVTINFSNFDTELNFDSLYIYDGNSTASPLIGSYTGTNSPGTITSSGGALSFRFRSDSYVTNAGWNSSWTCNLSTGVAAAQEQNFTVAPNPSGGVFTLELAKDQNSDISVYDVMGKEIYHSVTSSRSVVLDLSSVPDGVYFLKLTSSQKEFYKKIIKKN